jgi:hypothetical protein
MAKTEVAFTQAFEAPPKKGKKAAKSESVAPLSKADEMRKLAADIAEKDTKLKADKDALDAQKDTLIAWMAENPHTNTTDQYQITETIGGLEWTGAKGEMLKAKLAEFINLVDETYKTVELNNKAIYAGLQSDYTLVGILTKLGIQLNRKPNVFKLVAKK